ncbi:hypothetical protein LZ198_32755 [Myxococcus sp. K15C18031901]|uniref:hypothetical protein n=1 Tax=Myxococcus dinghuensis TaxID=2906761 RepID=UPI0020A6E827|nr:hypothetical protein [Myxococcus dinghuensis]MCP3103665.1 hypothetical protein [Myxococcus dinghuensis]
MRTPLLDTWTRSIAPLLLAGLLFTACSDDDPTPPSPDAGGGQDAGPDAGAPDSGTPDSGSPDAGAPDGGGPDAGASCAPEMTDVIQRGKWDPRFSIAGVSGMDGHVPHIYDLAKTASGDILATGYFRWLGTQATPPLIQRHGDTWQPVSKAWPQAIPGSGFSAVAANEDGTLALATNDTFGARSGEVWLATAEGVRVIGAFEGLVRTMAFVKGELWVAGLFQLADNGAIGLAIWDGAKWRFPTGGPADGPVYELLVDGDAVWVGGGFSQVGGVSSNKVARWNGAAWEAYDLPLPGNAVYALALGDDGTPYAGGTFAHDFSMDGVGSIARWTGTQWEMLDEGVSTGQFPGVVTDLAFTQGKLHVGGCFSHVNGKAWTNPEAIPANALARWSPQSGWEKWPNTSLPNRTAWFSPLFCGDEGPSAFPLWEVPIQRFLVDGDTLYLAGTFASVEDASSQSLAAFRDGQWRPEGARSGFGLSGSADKLAAGGPQCAVHAMGAISHAGGERVPRTVLRFGDSGWAPLGELPSSMECTDLEVNARGDVYVACTDWDVPQSHVLTWTGEDWRSLGDLREHGFISDMTLDELGRPWVATQAEDSVRVVRWDGEAFVKVADGFDGPVSTIALRPENPDPDHPAFVATGEFTHVNRLVAQRIVHWNGTTFETLGTGSVTSVITAAYGKRGIFMSTNAEYGMDGLPVPGRITLGHWSGKEWVELATPERGLLPPLDASSGGVHSFRKLIATGDHLVAVGTVIPEDRGPSHAFVFDGERLVPIGQGVNAISVDAVAVTPEGLWVGGLIAEAGRDDTLIPSVGVAHFGLDVPAP